MLPDAPLRALFQQPGDDATQVVSCTGSNVTRWLEANHSLKRVKEGTALQSINSHIDFLLSVVLTDKQTNGRIARWTGRRTDRQRDRLTDSTYTHACHIYMSDMSFKMPLMCLYKTPHGY